MTKRKLSPVEGRIVPLEDGTPWPDNGKQGDDRKLVDHEVAMTRYYRRRVRDGDLRDKQAEADRKAAEREAAKAEADRTAPKASDKGDK